MSKIHVFNAGPCLLPQVAVEHAREALLDFKGTGVSLISISHRTKEWEETMNETRALWRELLNIPEEYETVFLGGGASLQFCMVPFNMLEKKAAYLNTGVWSKKALKEAKGFGEAVEVAASTTDIPTDYEIPQDADYFHITTNNTIFGTEINDEKLAEIYKKKGNVPLVADMSSDILSRPIDVSQYDIIYGGAQKNLAPAGVTFVIIKESCLGKVSRYIPTMLNYQTHIDGGSMFNTPPVLPVYTALLTLRWLKANGGKTYADAIEAYRLIIEEKKHSKTSIDSQFEYNTYIRDFFADNKGSSLGDAIRCWKYKKNLKGHNRYEPSDLTALDKE